LKEQLKAHLANLVEQGKIEPWQDRMLEAGQEWEPQIKAALETADIFLLLVSPQFMASQFIKNVELKMALAKRKDGAARVIPIVLRPVDLVGTELATLQSLPKDAKPVTEWGNQDAAFLNVVQGLRKVIESMQAGTVKPETQPMVQPSNPQVHPSPNQQPQAHLQRLSTTGESSRRGERRFLTESMEERNQSVQYPERKVVRRSSESRPLTIKITQVISKAWYFILPILLLWILIGSQQQNVEARSGQGEISGFLALGALGGFLTGTLIYLAWQRTTRSRIQMDAALLYSLIGLIVGGLLWVLIYRIVGLNFIKAHGILIGLGLGLAVSGLLLCQLALRLDNNLHQ
jgi:uncharacterized integral membrane protein